MSGPDSPPLLEVKALGRAYEGGALQVLQDVSLTLHLGEAVAVMGPSGSGKSTLLACVGALDTPTTGVIGIRGVALRGHPDLPGLRAATIGFVFQQHHMVPALTLLENVELPLHACAIAAAERRPRALAALAAVGLAARAAHRPARVSGGERQRAAVARALVTRPALLLADEPTGSVDRATAAQVMDLLLAPVRAGDAGLLLVTHDPDIAARADRILRLREGRLV